MRFLCWLFGHRWRDEKEFASCARCHKCESWREITRQRSYLMRESMNIPRSMMKPRKARPLSNCKDAWYYIDPRRIIVVTQSDAVTTQVILTRRQLEQALKVMKS